MQCEIVDSSVAWKESGSVRTHTNISVRACVRVEKRRRERESEEDNVMMSHPDIYKNNSPFEAREMEEDKPTTSPAPSIHRRTYQ